MIDIQEIITQLERQRAAIDNALEALREVGGQAPAKRGRPKGSKRSMSEDGRRRQVEAIRAYWAKKKAGEKSAGSKPATKKRGLTAAGRKALSANMSRMWAAKRAASKKG